MGWHGSTITVLDGDRISIKPLYITPVPNAREVKLIFEYFKEGSPELIALGLMAIQGMRPAEIPRLRWPDFIIENGRVVGMYHLVYKPQNRKSKTGNSYFFKQVKKDFYSSWLSDQIIAYAKTCPAYPNNRVFPWTTHDGIGKAFRLFRKAVIKKGGEYDVFKEKDTVTVYGPVRDHYRISVYSLRRFAFTWHFYMTHNQDCVKLSLAMGHTHTSTSLKHYVFPNDTIGLTEEMMRSGISIDQFIHLEGRQQMRLVSFDPSWEKRFTPAGQRTLGDF